MFHSKAFLFASLLPPFQVFGVRVLTVFYSTQMGVFERLLGMGSLECPKAPLIHWHVAIPNYNGDIGLISLEVIALATFLGHQALVAPIIASRFLLDSCPLLLKAIGASNLRPFPFQVHLRLVRQLLPPRVATRQNHSVMYQNGCHKHYFFKK